MKRNNESSVLIVDDCKENIEALRSILEDSYDIYVAINGVNALKVIEHSNPDLVILDVAMPGMDGFEVHEEMKKRNFVMPVIFITAESSSFKETRGLVLGAVDYIIKPYNPDIVSIKVKNQIENKKYRSSLESLVKKQTKEISSSREAIIMGMSLLAEGRDQSTGAHIKRIQLYTSILANQFAKMYPDLLTHEQAEQMVLLSPLHDIGKVYTPDSVLLKQGPLTPEEFTLIKEHTVWGAKVLKETQTFFQDSDILNVAIAIAESHHERFDGTGYPNGLKGEEIPLVARILMLADVYDALTSKRVYKTEFSHEKAMDVITIGDGRTKPTHFDPMVLEAFLNVSEDFRTFGEKAFYAS